MKPCDPNDCAITQRLDLTRSTKAEKQRLAEYYYDQNLFGGRWTMERIAEKLGVTQGTVSNWLRDFNLLDANKSKHAKTDSNPKGAGRKKGRRTASRRNDTPQAAKAAAMVLSGGMTNAEAGAASGLGSELVTRIAVARAEGYMQGAADKASSESLSLTAQQRLEGAIRLRQHQQNIEFEARVADEVKKRTEFAFPHLKAKLAHAEAISASYTPRFSKKDCQAVARCLHPDTWQSLKVPAELAARLRTAFAIFAKMQSFLCVE